jgi:decaprenylphospho-beta-D-ribofuranose 2-oxidase
VPVTPAPHLTSLSGWGRFPVLDCMVAEAATTDQASRPLPILPSIARGNGRSYGDSSLSPTYTFSTRRLDRMLAFDEATGSLTCEAGTLLSDIIALFVPRGWFPPVTPGTKFVTVGGMIASDVHGKNHHLAGSFCDHVASFDLALGDGTVLHCSRAEHPDLFAATCGGMGLTGVLLRASFTLIPVATSRIEQKIERAPNLESSMALFEASQSWTYSVAWVDCLATGTDLGRSAVIIGEHAAVERLRECDRATPFQRPRYKSKRLPFDLPHAALNKVSVRLFNSIYYHLQKPSTTLVDLEPYFYPLDKLLEWNRIYGRRGFVQYQCVLPLDASRGGLTELLGAIARNGSASFLTVLKRLGRVSLGYLSFPMEGYTLALDFPAKPETLRLLERLDAIVEAHGGRLYLAKDARTSARMIEATYPKLATFREVRRRYGLDQRFCSAQSARLEL